MACVGLFEGRGLHVFTDHVGNWTYVTNLRTYEWSSGGGGDEGSGSGGGGCGGGGGGSCGGRYYNRGASRLTYQFLFKVIFIQGLFSKLFFLFARLLLTHQFFLINSQTIACDYTYFPSNVRQWTDSRVSIGKHNNEVWFFDSEKRTMKRGCWCVSIFDHFQKWITLFRWYTALMIKKKYNISI